MIWVFDDLETAGDQPLSRPTLERLVEAVAHRPDLWEPHIDRGSPVRMYGSLYRDARVDVWAILWRPGSDTGWHDHDMSSGAVRIVEGALSESELRLGLPERTRGYRAGERFSFAPSRIHRLVCEQAGAVSIHAYSAPLWRMGQYAVDDDGALHRVSVTYADELRPLQVSAA